MPICSPLSVAKFSDLFRGRSEAYGVHEPSQEVDEKGKRKGRSYTKTGLLTNQQYSDHLAGITGLGVVPICADDKCYFAAIDVDEYNGERDRLVSIIYDNNLPINPFRSKSGGLHLFTFFRSDSPEPASQVVPVVQELRDLLGLPATTEVFPKQKSVSGGVGNWINLPYFGDSTRCLIDNQGRDMPFENALSYLEERRFSLQEIRGMLDAMPFSDGPPCLQTLFLQGVTKNRNNYLFSAACYFKARDGEERYIDSLKELNAALPDPLDESELESTVIATHSKKDYSYRCSDAPINGFCNKGKCKSRRFGVGNGEVSELTFGMLTQYLSDPPYYQWRINDKEFRFDTEDDLIKQNEFQKQCVRILHYKPSTLKQDVWDRKINAALKNIEVKGVDKLSSFDMGAMFMDYLIEFLTKRAMAANRSQILLGRVWHETSEDGFIFRANDFARFLTEQKRFKAYSFPEIESRIRNLGGEPRKYEIDSRNKNVSVWFLPHEQIKVYDTEVEDAYSQLDFLVEAEKSSEESF